MWTPPLHARRGQGNRRAAAAKAGRQCFIAAKDVLDIYRFRWQIELAFKRMKSLPFLGDLPARDPPLARCFLYSKLLAALLLEDFTSEILSFSPWGFRLASTSTISVAYSESAP